MLKKAFAALAVAGLLTLGGASAAFADYPPIVRCLAGASTLSVGQATVITCQDLRPNVTGTLTVTGPGVNDDTLSSFVFAAPIGTDSVTKTTTPQGTVSVNFVAPAEGNFTVNLVVEDGQTGSTEIDVVAPGSGGGAGGGLPPTGGTVPAGAIWLGVGAVGLGGIAIAAALASRRSRSSR